MASQNRSGSPFVTPTFQSVLNTQIAKVMNALDSGQYEIAYNCIKTLVLSLNPKHTEALRKNDLAHIDNQLLEVEKKRSIDSYQTLRMQTTAKKNIAKRYVRDLFFKVMSLLHEKGYLEKQAIQPKARGRGRLKI